MRACETSIFIRSVTIPTVLAGLFNLSPENPGRDRRGCTAKLSRARTTRVLISVLHYAAAVVTATGSISPAIDDNNDTDNSHEPYFMAFTRWPHGTARLAFAAR